MNPFIFKVLAEETTPQVDDLLKNSSLEGSSLEAFGKTVDDIGGGTYQLIYKAGIYAVVIGIMVAGFVLIVSNSGTRGEAKSNLITKIAGGFLIFAAASIAVLLQRAGIGFLSN